MSSINYLIQENACMNCGACCAFFRVSFHWMETNLIEGGLVPSELTEQLSQSRVFMKGTQTKSKRCVALKGEIGSCVSCSIYENRPSPCRDFMMHGENGISNEDCNRARLAFGLPPIHPNKPFETEPTVPNAA